MKTKEFKKKLQKITEEIKFAEGLIVFLDTFELMMKEKVAEKVKEHRTPIEKSFKNACNELEDLQRNHCPNRKKHEECKKCPVCELQYVVTGVD